MARSRRLFLFFFSSFLFLSVAVSQSIIRMVPGGGRDVRVRKDDDLFCESWRFTVEANDAGVWSTIPDRCLRFVKSYCTGDRYASDSEMVATDSFAFAGGVKIAGDGKDVWIFDIDETLLSNLPYYAAHGFGSEVFNETSFDEWVDLARAPPLPSSSKLYKQLQNLGFQLVLLTGRSEAQRNVTVDNLLFAGYTLWERLILRGPSDKGKTALAYKSEKRKVLVAEGFRIHGSSGDQWSDLLGSPISTRSFKLPNPMYYIE